MGRNFICYEPEYVEKFQCDGTACGALCCRNWGITIDKETYHKYKLIPQRKLRQKILAAIDTITEAGRARGRRSFGYGWPLYHAIHRFGYGASLFKRFASKGHFGMLF